MFSRDIRLYHYMFALFYLIHNIILRFIIIIIISLIAAHLFSWGSLRASKALCQVSRLRLSMAENWRFWILVISQKKRS